MAEYGNSGGENEQVVQMSRFSSSDREGGVFSSIKSRLGFGDKGSSSRGSDDYDDYGDYDDYDYDDDYDDKPSSSSRDWDRGGRSQRYDDYDNYDDYDSRGRRYSDDSPSTRYNTIDPYTTRRSGGDMPSLVTREDIKMSTPLPEIPPIDTDYDSGRAVIDDTTPAPYSPADRAGDYTRQRGDGVDSLFGSSAPVSSGALRTLRVIKPVSYEDAEGVARGIKLGSVVVLALRNTPDDLAKRILDFSFGAASALDANVECPGEKVFAIAKGRALDEAEITQLRNQGVL